ncbi:MAG: hypothetical protein HKM89_15610 [Gemmatimonadales bacterium]|nr:hypothetical protein [Gemmatimonadales bacterium]
MAILVSLVGLALVLVGVFGTVSPDRLADTVRAWSVRGRFLTVVIVRLVIGVTFILAAPETRFPTAILVLGVLVLVAAVALMFAGSKRVDALIQWWFRQSKGFTRSGSMLVAVLGGALVYASV